MIEIIIPEVLGELVPAAARMALRRNNLDTHWLVDEYLRHRSIFFDGFTESVCEILDDTDLDLHIACGNIEHVFDRIFPHQTRGVYVDAIEPLTEDPKHGTRLTVEFEQ